MLVLASSGGGVCQIPKPAEITVVPKSDPLEIDTSVTHQEIQNRNIDTINPYGFSSTSHTNGYMSGRISMTSEVSLDYKQANRMHAFCLWYDKVTINISISPKIVIAKEVAESMIADE